MFTWIAYVAVFCTLLATAQTDTHMPTQDKFPMSKASKQPDVQIDGRWSSLILQPPSQY